MSPYTSKSLVWWGRREMLINLLVNVMSARKKFFCCLKTQMGRKKIFSFLFKSKTYPMTTNKCPNVCVRIKCQKFLQNTQNHYKHVKPLNKNDKSNSAHYPVLKKETDSADYPAKQIQYVVPLHPDIFINDWTWVYFLVL